MAQLVEKIEKPVWNGLLQHIVIYSLEMAADVFINRHIGGIIGRRRLLAMSCVIQFDDLRDAMLAP